MQKHIYILRLQEDRYFIHFSEIKHYKMILRECEIYYDYAKKFKPLSIIESHPLTNYLDIDKTVKFYMFLFGYDNVRGGSYIDEKLPEFLEKTIIQEFKIVEREKLEFTNTFQEILENYEYREFQTMDEIIQEIDVVQQKYLLYISEKERLEKTKFFIVNGKRKNMNYFYPEDMDWLFECCLLNEHTNNTEINSIDIEKRLKSNYVKKYKTMLVFMKQLYNIFEYYDLFSEYGIEKSVYLKYPEFLFDGFMYDTHTKNSVELLKTYKTIQHMGNIVYNKIVEQEYDVMSYGFGYDWKAKRILYILERKREKFGKPLLFFDEYFI